MQTRLKNKVAIFGGAGRGMGRATARLFAQEGARVAVAAREAQKGEETAELIQAAGGEVMHFAGDLTERPFVERMVTDVIARWGHLDILYCGAGGFFEPALSFEEMDGLDEFFDLAVTNTLKAPYNLLQVCRPHLRGGGAVITVAASFRVRQEGNAAYGAAKCGVIGLTEGLAKELYPDGIRVNCIGSGLLRAPQAGGTLKPVTGLARTGCPEDVAYAALYLASDEASWLTGQVLNVDGGVDVGARPLWQYEN